MNLEDFHKTYFSCLKKKSEEVKRIMALESNNEKWFQGEMVLAFSVYDILSSDFFNNESNDIDDKIWNRTIKDGILSIECDIYKAVKTGKNKSTSRRMVDFLLADQDSYTFSELKIIWFWKNKDDFNVYDYLVTKSVLDDAWRLKNNLYKAYKDASPNLFLSLICIRDESTYDKNYIKHETIKAINDYLETSSIREDKDVCFGDIISYPYKYANMFCEENDEAKYVISLMTIQI